MKYKYIPASEQVSSRWSGGSTTQLYIYPEDADYKIRNFQFRLSSAKVEVEESVFASLPGIQRHLMVLDGELDIAHKGHHRAVLKPFDADFFRGDWETQARGCVTDFNLMLSANTKGQLKAVNLEAQQNYLIDSEGYRFVAIYLWKGRLGVEQCELRMAQGDFLIYDLCEGGTVPQVTAIDSDTTLVLSYITPI